MKDHASVCREQQRIERAEANGALEALDRLFGFARIFVGPAALLPRQRRVRIERHRAVDHLLGLLDIAEYVRRHAAGDAQGVRVILVDTERQGEKPAAFHHGLL